MKKLYAIQLSFLVLLVTACSSPNVETTQTELSIHFENSAKFEIIMHKLDNLIFEKFRSELDRDEKRIEYTKDMVSILDELVLNTKEIQGLQESQWTQKQSTDYMKFAKELDSKAKGLQKIVSEYKTEEIASTLDSIVNTCNRCHDALR